MSAYVVGLDLGQAADWTAVAVLERVERVTGEHTVTETDWMNPPGWPVTTAPLKPVAVQRERTVTETTTEYHVTHLERRRGVSYQVVGARVKELLGTPALAGATLVLDWTGCGRPVADQLKALGLAPVCVTIHAGTNVSGGGREFGVPKRDLVAAVQVPLQNGQLKIAAGLALAPPLRDELLNFRVTIDPKTAHDSYAAWRESQHDDLVLAVALAVWWASRPRKTWVAY